MTQYSIEQLQTELNDIIQAVEQGETIEIMRQGERMAVLMPVNEYDRLKKEKPGFGAALKAFRQKYEVET